MTVTELEQKLEKAKQQEHLNNITSELNELIKNYKGKCFGTHTFDKYHAAATMSAVKYEKFFIKEDKIYVTEHIIRLTHLDAHYKKSMKQIDYSRNINTRQLSGYNSHNAHYNLSSGYSYFKKEISESTFKSLWESGEEAAVIIKSAFKGNVDVKEWITQGNHSEESQIEKCIKDIGIDLIDFKDHPEIYRVIEYRTLPMFDRRRWMPRIYAKPILEWLVSQIEKDLHDPWYSLKRIKTLQEEVSTIKNFIKKEL